MSKFKRCFLAGFLPGVWLSVGSVLFLLILALPAMAQYRNFGQSYGGGFNNYGGGGTTITEAGTTTAGDTIITGEGTGTAVPASASGAVLA